MRKKAIWTEDEKQKQSQRMKDRWADPAIREMMLSGLRAAAQENAEESRQALTQRWADPEWKAKTAKAQSEGAKARWADPEKRAKFLAQRKAAKDAKKDK